MKRGVIVDTGVLVALLNKKDSYHQWAMSQLKTIQPPLLTCEAVISEVSFLTARNKQGMAAIFNYLKLGIIETPFCFLT
jgi:predicted nucleic acid-binding protein